MSMLCVMATFDTALEEKVLILQRSLGVSEHLSAHITLGTYVGAPRAELTRRALLIARVATRFPVRFSSIGVFKEKALFLTPTANPTLMNLYNRLHSELDEFATPYTAKSCGSWTPHCTLCGYTPEALAAALDCFEEMEGLITGLVVKDCDQGFAQVARYAFPRMPASPELVAAGQR